MNRAENDIVELPERKPLSSQTPEDDALTQRALALLEGKVKPPNEMISYMCERATIARKKHKEYADRVMLVERQLADMRRQAIEYRGAMASYADDVKLLLVRYDAETKAGNHDEKRGNGK